MVFTIYNDNNIDKDKDKDNTMEPTKTTEEYDSTVDAMNRQFANITVQDDIRRVNSFSMPSEKLTATFDILATDMMNAKKTQRTYTEQEDDCPFRNNANCCSKNIRAN